MSQAYSNLDREHEPHALPDIEVFEVTSKYPFPKEDESYLDPGFYWLCCFPGCLPDSDPNGPFPTKAEALADAQSNQD